MHPHLLHQPPQPRRGAAGSITQAFSHRHDDFLPSQPDLPLIARQDRRPQTVSRWAGPSAHGWYGGDHPLAAPNPVGEHRAKP